MNNTKLEVYFFLISLIILLNPDYALKANVIVTN